MSGRRRVLAATPGMLCFAPAVVVHGGRRLLAYSAGAEADRAFGTRRHDDGRAESWYCGGRNRILVAALPAAGTAVTSAEAVLPVPAGVRDMTGVSLASDGRLLRAWFSVRSAVGSWQVYHCASGDSGLTWTAPALVLAPGPADGTDGEHVLLPAVLLRRDGWWMWYAGRDGANRRVYLARSADGIHWQRHGVALGLGPAGSPDAYATDCPAVAVAGGMLVMLYGAGSSRSIAAAASRDGVRWRRLGPVVHRGGPGEPDSAYAFYPALLPAGPGHAELVYAGEDDHGQWRVLHGGVLDLRAVAARRVPLPCPSQVAGTVASIRAGVPASYLHEPEDCHGPALAWRSPDGLIRQLRPSSVPVFEVRAPGSPAVVVKLARSRALAEREADGAHVLSRFLPVPAMALHYHGDHVAVVMEHLDGASLRALATAGDSRLAPLIAAVTERLAAVTAATAVPAARAGRPAQTRQDASMTRDWIGEIARRLAPWADAPVYLNGRPACLTPAQATEAAACLTARPPRMLAYSSGDVHLGNIHVAPAGIRWWLLDLEFAGLHDPDQVTAGFLASLLKHAGLITSATAEARAGGLHVTARLRGEAASRMLGTPFLLERLACGVADPARVFAFTVAALRFRLGAGQPGRLPPPAALAALALAARMTGQDQP